MTKLSVNINKIATLRNSRGNNIPNIIKSTIDIQKFGANGITLHPRPDERHIKYKDVYNIKNVINTELNIEGNPNKNFMNLVLDVKPNQVTLVPDSNNVITSNEGWDTNKYKNFLKDIIIELKNKNIRTSIFLNPDPYLINSASQTGTDIVELYTGIFAKNFLEKKLECMNMYTETAKQAISNNLEINAGHDLNLNNISYLFKIIPKLREVSVGHSLISESLYFGLKKTIQLYLKKLKNPNKYI